MQCQFSMNVSPLLYPITVTILFLLFVIHTSASLIVCALESEFLDLNLASPLISCVNIIKLLSHHVPQFPHAYKYISTCSMGSFQD